MQAEDTIAALATAPGRGGIAIVRVSGTRAEEMLRALFMPAGTCSYVSHMLYYGHAIYQGETLDECMAVLMRAPRSYTREDVTEFHLHGGEYAAHSVLKALFDLGVRPAEPGEFTRRAFLNGRVDLSRAEATMALISAQGRAAARAAMRQLSGGPSAFVRGAQDRLLALLSGVEAAIDYPEEISQEEAAGALEKGARALAEELEKACDERGARVLESGLEVVLCGLPNVGKSSLLNRLLSQDRAIVTDTPGTTRDILRDSAYINGIKVNFSDTAGIRESDEKVERIGVERARQAVLGADVAVLLLDGSRQATREDEALINLVSPLPHILVVSKSDLPPKLSLSRIKDPIFLSAHTGQGIDQLSDAIVSFAGHGGETPLTQSRHMALARLAAGHLNAAADACQSGVSVDLSAVDLHEALRALGEITGDQVSESLLDNIFSRFCVGK